MFLIKYENRSDILSGYFHFHSKVIIISLKNHWQITVQYLFLNEKINKKKIYFLIVFEKSTLKNHTKNSFYSWWLYDYIFSIFNFIVYSKFWKFFPQNFHFL